MNTIPISKSSYCRRDEHLTCKNVAARCGCDCHGPGGQMPNPTTTPLRPTPPATTDRNGTPPPGPAGLVWEEPPEGRRSGPAAHLIDPLIVAELQEAKGRWARVKTYKAKTSAQTARAKITKGALGPGWEVVARQIPGGSALWLRYVGAGK